MGPAGHPSDPGLPVLSKDTLCWDAVPGFGVKVTPKGRKVFRVMYRLAGAGSRLSIASARYWIKFVHAD